MSPRITLLAPLTALLAACGGSDAPAATADATVASCAIDNGLPVAEVDVTNTGDEPQSFAVTVTFLADGNEVGSGLEYTSLIDPGAVDSVRAGSMSGDASAVDDCQVQLEGYASAE